MKQKVPSAMYSKEFREQAVKLVAEEGLNPKQAARRLTLFTASSWAMSG